MAGLSMITATSWRLRPSPILPPPATKTPHLPPLWGPHLWSTAATLPTPSPPPHQPTPPLPRLFGPRIFGRRQLHYRHPPAPSLPPLRSRHCRYRPV